MRTVWKMGIMAAALTGAASAQLPKSVLNSLPPGFIPEGATTTVFGTVKCPDPPEDSYKPECCKITLDIDANGKVTKADALCTFKPLEKMMAACEAKVPQERQITNNGPVPYTTTYFQEHYPTLRRGSEIAILEKQAKAACDSLR